MKTEITKKDLIEKNYFDFQIEEVMSSLKPIGAELKHRKVCGQKIVGYEFVEVSCDKGNFILRYITDSDMRIGFLRELNS